MRTAYVNISFSAAIDPEEEERLSSALYDLLDPPIELSTTKATLATGVDIEITYPD